MTQPILAEATDYGRLYRKPTTDPATLPGSAEEALRQGLLFPSVTNIIDVLSKPYLQKWYAKRAAEDAVEVTKSHPGLIASKPWKAIDWIKKAAERTSEAAASLGDEVHQVVEALSLGVEDVAISAAAAPYVESWRNFVADFSPEFTHVEATCFGEVGAADGTVLGYAGTADFICRINGLTLVGDNKTGKSIHTEAALQLAALAHATEITADNETLAPMPRIDGGIVLHLTANGYVVYPVDVHGDVWAEFVKMRGLWDFHQANLNSKSPLYIAGAVTSPAGLPFTATPTAVSAVAEKKAPRARKGA